MLPLAAPALPLHSAGKYVAGAYVVFVLLLLVYLAIMAVRASRTERALAELNRELAARQSVPDFVRHGEFAPGADVAEPGPQRETESVP